MYDDEHSVVSAIRSGARAFVLKKASDNDLAGRAAHGRQGWLLSKPAGLRPAAASHSERRPGIHARRRPLLTSLAARAASAAAGGRGQNQQGNRGDAGSRSANRPQLSQDHDEEAWRQQRRGPHSGGAGGRCHALPRFRPEATSQLRWTRPGVHFPSPTRTCIFSRTVFSLRSPSKRKSPIATLPAAARSWQPAREDRLSCWRPLGPRTRPVRRREGRSNR